MKWRLLWIPVVVIVADQITKHLALQHLSAGDVPVTSFFRFALAFNTGAAFSFLADAGGWQNYFFVGVAVVVSGIILAMFRKLESKDMQLAVALMLVLGGAIGNVIDRLRFGYVVDFIDVYYRHWHWPTFNIADSAISIGAVLLILDAFGLSLFRSSTGAAS
jgi:signal peptidase II